jgi:hypothetical protein
MLTDQQATLIAIGWVLAAMSGAVALFVYWTDKRADAKRAKDPS